MSIRKTAVLSFVLAAIATALAAAPGTLGDLKWDGKKYAGALLPVDTAKSYLLTGEFTAETDTKEFTFGLELFDRNKRPIWPHEVRAIPGTETETVRPAKKGDRELWVKNASSWNIAAARILALGGVHRSPGLPARSSRTSRALISNVPASTFTIFQENPSGMMTVTSAVPLERFTGSYQVKTSFASAYP